MSDQDKKAKGSTKEAKGVDASAEKASKKRKRESKAGGKGEGGVKEEK
jgi:hypothetical protein